MDISYDEAHQLLARIADPGVHVNVLDMNEAAPTRWNVARVGDRIRFTTYLSVTVAPGRERVLANVQDLSLDQMRRFAQDILALTTPEDAGALAPTPGGPVEGAVAAGGATPAQAMLGAATRPAEGGERGSGGDGG